MKSSKLKLKYRERKRMHNSANGEVWLSKFAEKEEAILEKL